MFFFLSYSIKSSRPTIQSRSKFREVKSYLFFVPFKSAIAIIYIVLRQFPESTDIQLSPLRSLTVFYVFVFFESAFLKSLVESGREMKCLLWF